MSSTASLATAAEAWVPAAAGQRKGDANGDADKKAAQYLIRNVASLRQPLQLKKGICREASVVDARRDRSRGDCGRGEQ